MPQSMDPMELANALGGGCGLKDKDSARQTAKIRGDDTGTTGAR
jgi:hypothetical protein